MNKTLTGKGTLTAFGETPSNTATKDVTVKLAVENWTPTATCSCNPANVEFDGKNVKTTVTVNASITGVSSSSISKWIFYGHDGDGAQSQTSTVTPTGDKTKATTAFSYITPTSKMTEDSYKSKFEQRAVIILTDGTRKETSLVVCYTVITKPGATPPPTDEPEPTEPPEPPMPSGPVAIITGPTKVKAGATLPYPIDGSNSFDWQGKDIVMWTWDHKVAQETPIYDIKFDEPGTYDIILNVKNSAGAWSEEATHTVEVVPDQPPVTTIAVPPEETRLGSVRVQSNVYSTDGDVIGQHTFEMKYDANNNGFEDDEWKKVQESDASAYVFTPNRVGTYLFRETACEANGSCANTDAQPESERTLIVHNLAPSIDVVTSSDQTDTADKTLLHMSTLYNTGTVASLTKGTTGDKSGWNYYNGVLATKNYRTNIGMFNENFGVVDPYYGDDFVNRTLYASIQNSPKLSLIGKVNSATQIYSDEKYIYYVSDNRYLSGVYPQAQIKIYTKDMQYVTTSTINYTYSLRNSNLMIKGERLYLTTYDEMRNVLTAVIDRNTGAIIRDKVPMGSFTDFLNPKGYVNTNSLYADDKGVIGMMSGNITGSDPYYGRYSYDFSSVTSYLTGGYWNHFFIKQYYSQSGTNLYVNTGGEWDTGNSVLFDSNGIETSILEQPSTGPLAYMLLGIDENRNYYSVGRVGFYKGNPKLAIHNAAGKLLKLVDWPIELQSDSSYKQYSGSNSWDVVYKTERTDLFYTVDRLGNIWTSADGWVCVITPNGEFKRITKLNYNAYTGGWNNMYTFGILVGSDGLVTFLHYYRNAYTGADTSLQVVVVDPKTYSVVSNTTIPEFYSKDGSDYWQYTTPILRDRNQGGFSSIPYKAVPIGDQKYLIYADYANSSYNRYGDNLMSNVYLLDASGALTYPKAFDIGVPTEDIWVGSKVDEGLILQGDLKAANASAAGAGYVYLAQDKDNYYSAEFEGGQLKVKKTVAGVTTLVKSKTFSLVPGQTYTLKFVPEGTGFSLYVNKLKQWTIDNAGWTSGKYGVISRGQPGVEFTNVTTEPQVGASAGKIYGVVLVNEPLTYDVTFDDPESDKRITAGEAWIYSHNPNVFLNPQGTWSGSGQSFSTPVTSFSLPGEYPFHFKTRDDPNPNYLYPSDVFDSYRQESNEVNGTIRVHRRPVASFVATADSSGNVSYIDNSYDPDRYDPSTGAYSKEATGLDYRSTKGVFTHRWRILEPNTADFKYIDHPPTKVTVSGHYVLELQVQDEYGAWAAEWARQEFDVDAATPIAPPIAGFTVNPLSTYRGVPVTINSTASDPQDGDRTNLAHQYYIKPAGGAETLASGSRTSWEKVFNSLGIFSIRQIVTNSYGLTDQTIGQVNIVNRKPVTQVAVPASTDSTNPTVFETVRPTFTWTYLDADADPQTKYQLRIYKYGGYSYLDTGEINSGTKAWTPTVDIPEEINFYVRVRVYDGYDWSDWSDPKYFVIITNKPPTGDFTWTPSPVYEGDTVGLNTFVADPDDDVLDVTYKIVSPSGAEKGYSYALSSPYPTTGPVQRLVEPGIWTVTMTVSDRRAPAITILHTIEVLPLSIAGFVRHTEAWEANRIAYNKKHPEAVRPVEWFWAGEAFVLDAATTDTGSSATKPVEVTAAASDSLRLGLSPAHPVSLVDWTGLLGSKEAGQPLSELPEGLYTFVFTVRYNNGTVKTASVTVRLVDQVGNYVQVHRIT